MGRWWSEANTWLKWVLGVVSVALLIGVGIVATDGPLRSLTQRTVATGLRTQGMFGSTPTVTIDGWPVVVRALTGFPEVTVSGESLLVRSGQLGLTLNDVRLTLTGVHLTPNSAHIDVLTGSAALSYQTLNDAYRGEVAYAGDGRIRVAEVVAVGGRDITAVISGKPSLNSDTQTVDLTDIRLAPGGSTVPGVSDATLAKVLVSAVPVGLPNGLEITSVEATPAGVVLGVSGESLVFALG